MSYEDFALEKYKLDRKHELELNRATAAYEHATLRTFMVLNGGAAVAFLTLLGAVWNSDSRPIFVLVIMAIGSWSVGMVLTAVATKRAYKGQQGYATAYHLRRQAEEVRRLGGDAETLLRLGLGNIDSADSLNNDATVAKKEAKPRFDKAFTWTSLAMVFFVIGLACAALSMSPREYSDLWDCLKAGSSNSKSILNHGYTLNTQTETKEKQPIDLPKY